MGDRTAIEWTEATWNPVVGCTKVSPGCAHCYAETMAHRLRGMARADLRAGRNPGRKRHYLDVVDDAGRWNGTVRLVPEALDEPLRWARPARVFVNSMSDLFHEGVPDEYILRVFDAMRRCTRAGGQNCGRIGGSGHTFQVLTKRAARMRDFVARLYFDGTRYALADAAPGRGLRGNPQIWLGVSAEDQARADGRIPLLLETPAAVRFLSVEPLLGPVNLGLNRPRLDGIHWVIVGGESGPGARPCDLAWVRSLVGQCREAGVAVFCKQLGAFPAVDATEAAGRWRRPHPDHPDRSCLHLCDPKGGDPAEWPSDLRVREFPEVKR